MARKKNYKVPGVYFSAKRALGATKAKSRIARFTGIPTSKTGRQRKIGKALLGGGCLLQVVILSMLVIAITLFVFCLSG